MDDGNTSPPVLHILTVPPPPRTRRPCLHSQLVPRPTDAALFLCFLSHPFPSYLFLSCPILSYPILSQDLETEQEVVQTILPYARLGSGITLTDGRSSALLGEMTPAASVQLLERQRWAC